MVEALDQTDQGLDQVVVALDQMVGALNQSHEVPPDAGLLHEADSDLNQRMV